MRRPSLRIARGNTGLLLVDIQERLLPAMFENCCVGLGRMRDAGTAILSAEIALFELLGRAGTDEFEQILTLVK
jgi:hypothetical protein